MGELPEEIGAIATDLVDCAFVARKKLGVGLLEEMYLQGTAIELQRRGRCVERKARYPVLYDGVEIGKTKEIDMIVDGCVLLEGKAVEGFHPTHYAQTLTYLSLSRLPLGFLINFYAIPFGSGVKRLLAPTPAPP